LNGDRVLILGDVFERHDVAALAELDGLGAQHGGGQEQEEG